MLKEKGPVECKNKSTIICIKSCGKSVTWNYINCKGQINVEGTHVNIVGGGGRPFWYRLVH